MALSLTRSWEALSLSILCGENVFALKHERTRRSVISSSTTFA
jgi:hypothetical protein